MNLDLGYNLGRSSSDWEQTGLLNVVGNFFFCPEKLNSRGGTTDHRHCRSLPELPPTPPPIRRSTQTLLNGPLWSVPRRRGTGADP